MIATEAFWIGYLFISSNYSDKVMIARALSKVKSISNVEEEVEVVKLCILL